MAGTSSQGSSNQSFVDPVQQAYNKDLYSQARSLSNSQADFSQQATNTLQPLYQSALDTYNQGSGSDFSSSVTGGDNQGMQTLLDLQSSNTNPYLDAQYDAALGGVNRNLSRNILPSIRDNAISSGQSGSSRHGIAEGLALSDANQQATELAGQLYGGAYDQDQARRLSAAGGYLQSGLGAEGQAANNAAASIANAGQLYNLALDPYGKAWDPLNAYKGIVGNQTLVGKGSSSGSGFNIL